MSVRRELVASKKVSNISVRLINEQRILQQLYWNGGQTQLTLRNELRLSSPTITQALQAFKEAGLVLEGPEAASSGGRKPRLITFNYSAFHAVGVEIRRHHIAVVCRAGWCASTPSRSLLKTPPPTGGPSTAASTS